MYIVHRQKELYKIGDASLTIISIGHLCVFLYCIVCFNVLIQLLAAIVNKWCFK